MTLKELIIENAGSVQKLSVKMGMTPQNLYRKIRNTDGLTVAEMKRIAKMLHIDFQTVVNICCRTSGKR